MNYLSRGAIVLVLIGLVAAMTTGAAFAQDAPTLDQGQLQTQAAQEVVASWADQSPLNYYLALPVADYVAQAQSAMWAYDSGIPQELVGMQEIAAYESILSGGPSVPNTVDFEMAMWAYDNGIPQELVGMQEIAAYESILQGRPAEVFDTIAQDQTGETLDSLAIEGETPCDQC